MKWLVNVILTIAMIISLTVGLTIIAPYLAIAGVCGIIIFLINIFTKE